MAPSFRLNSQVSYLDSYQVQNLVGTPYQEFRGTIDYTKQSAIAAVALADERKRRLRGFRPRRSLASSQCNARRVVGHQHRRCSRCFQPITCSISRGGLRSTSASCSAWASPISRTATRRSCKGPPASQFPALNDVVGRSFYVGVTTRFLMRKKSSSRDHAEQWIKSMTTLRMQAYDAFTQHLLERRLLPGQFVSQRELAALTDMSLGAIPGDDPPSRG